MSIANHTLAKLRARKAGFGLGRDFYTSEAIHALDLELIFYREWLFAGHGSELPTPGSYMTLQIGAYPVVIVRGGDGVIRAFINSCRHRGARVCREERGRSSKLVCPYHQWTYELDGRLSGARQMGPGFERTQFALIRVHCEAVAGYIFVCVAADAPDFEPTRRMIEPYLAPHRLAEARVAFESTIIEEGNWKLVWENNRECYHCAGNHPELARTYPDTPALTGTQGAEADPLIAAHWQRCEAAGLPSRFELSADGQRRVARMPLLRDAVSYTMNGQAAVRRPLSDDIGAAGRIGALLFFHYPSSWNHVLADHAISFRVLPLGPKRTQLTTKWLVHRDAVEGRDYDLHDLTAVWRATNDQDSAIVRENQIGVDAPTYQPGPYAPAHETGVAQFIDWYASCLESRLAGEDLTRVA